MEFGAELRAARFSDRFAAYLLDTVPFAAGAVGTLWVLWVPLGRPPSADEAAKAAAAWVTLASLYQFLGNLSGATPGKRLLGLRVLAADGGPAGPVRSLVRAVGWVLSTPFFNFGFLVALFNPRTRALHDFLAGTVVVETYRKSPGTAAGIFLAAALSAVGLVSFQVWMSLSRLTAHDRAALAKADEGLAVVARVQEAYKASHGVYASSLEQLAQASGDPARFREAMSALYEPEPFRVEGGNRRWRATVAARDRRKTVIVREGP